MKLLSFCIAIKLNQCTNFENFFVCKTQVERSSCSYNFCQHSTALVLSRTRIYARLVSDISRWLCGR